MNNASINNVGFTVYCLCNVTQDYIHIHTYLRHMEVNHQQSVVSYLTNESLRYFLPVARKFVKKVVLSTITLPVVK